MKKKRKHTAHTQTHTHTLYAYKECKIYEQRNEVNVISYGATKWKTALKPSLKCNHKVPKNMNRKQNKKKL